MMALELHGTTITFQSGFFAEIQSVSVDGMSRAAHDKSHTGTDRWRTFFFSRLTDPGGLSVGIRYDPDTTPPINEAAETITITFPVPDGRDNGATIRCSGGMTEFSISGGAPDGMLEASCTLKFSGEPIFTASS